jgi:hypothetical protein
VADLKEEIEKAVEEIKEMTSLDENQQFSFGHENFGNDKVHGGSAFDQEVIQEREDEDESFTKTPPNN